MTEPTNGPTSSAPSPSPTPAEAPPAAASPALPGSPAAASPESTPAPSSKPTPDGLDPTYWDSAKGDINLDALNKDLAELRTAKAELDAMRGDIPEAPDKYEMKLADGAELPEGFEINADDPRLPAVREFAHANKMTQAEFSGLIALDAQFKAQEAAAFKKIIEGEQQKLGPDGGKARVGAIQQALVGKLGEDHVKHLMPMLVSKAQVDAFEALIRTMTTQGGSATGYQPGAGQQPGKISDEEWNRLSPTERFTFARERSAKRSA